jgi:hypothetical protein
LLTDIFVIETSDKNCPIDMIYTKDLKTDAFKYNTHEVVRAVELTKPSKVELYIRPFTAFG